MPRPHEPLRAPTPSFRGELGRGTYTASGATLSRDTVLKSKIAGVVGTAKMNLTGEATVAFTAASGDLPESGSNAKGRYVRFPDGAQICTHAMKAEYLSADRLQGDWTFPAAFSGAADYSWSAMPQVRDPDNTIDGINLAKMHNSTVYEASHSATKLFFRVGSEDSLLVSGDYAWVSLTATARLPDRVADFR